MSDWNIRKFNDNWEVCSKLYSCVRKNDKHIGKIYNDKKGSHWIEIMALQITDGVIVIGDLWDFEEEVCNTKVE
jgi:hypothetical protein